MPGKLLPMSILAGNRFSNTEGRKCSLKGDGDVWVSYAVQRCCCSCIFAVVWQGSLTDSILLSVVLIKSFSKHRLSATVGVGIIFDRVGLDRDELPRPD